MVHKRAIQSEGKVKAGIKFRTAKSNLAYQDPVRWLENLVEYLKHHKENPTNVIHPTFDIVTGKQKPKKRAKKKPTTKAK